MLSKALGKQFNDSSRVCGSYKLRSTKLLHPQDMNGNIKKLQYGYLIVDIHTWFILVLSLSTRALRGRFLPQPP